MTLEKDLADIEALLLRGAPRVFLSQVDALKLAAAKDGAKSTLARLALGVTAPKFEPHLAAAADSARAYGVRDALTLLDKPLASGTRTQSKAVTELIEGFDKAGADAVAKSRKLIASGADPDAYLAPLYGHANAVKARATDVVNRAGNEGVTEVADAEGSPTVWVAETNACVVCLAYSGTVVKPGGEFPGGLTYGRKSYFPGSVKTPPRHPNCRCVVEVLVNQEYADALRREADRSVLRGFSLESESMGTRIDAADRLIGKSVSAPKSVIAYSKRSIKAGKFPTRGRPLGGPTTPGKGPGFPPNAPKTPKAPAGPPRAPDGPALAPVLSPVSPKAPTRAPTRAPGDTDVARNLKAQIEALEREAKLYDGMLSPRFVKRRKVITDELDKMKKSLDIERLGNKTPALDGLPNAKPAPIASVVADANPGRNVGVYDNNCTNAVVAAELRTRGKSVIATTRPGRKGRPSAESARAWRDTNGQVRPFTEGLTDKDVIETVESWPEGSRGFVAGQCKMKKSGHIFTVEKINGKAVFHEPQVPDKAVGGGADYLEGLVHGKIDLLRVDDLVPTDELAGYVIADTAKVRATIAKKLAEKEAIFTDLVARRAKIDEIAKLNSVLARTEAEKNAYFARMVVYNAMAKEYNVLRRKWMRL